MPPPDASAGIQSITQNSDDGLTLAKNAVAGAMKASCSERLGATVTRKSW